MEEIKRNSEMRNQQNLSNVSYETNQYKERRHEGISTPGTSKTSYSQQSNEHGNSLAVSTSASLNTRPKYSTSNTQFPDSMIEVWNKDRTVKRDSSTSRTSNLQNVNSAKNFTTAAMKRPIPSFSPSLAKYYRKDLISHVADKQADFVEQKADHCWEETFYFGGFNCTEVSTKLKMARARVRDAEIHTTAQEVKLLALDEEMNELEK